VFDAVPQQPADPIQRVVAMAAVAEGVLLDPAADLVEGLGAQADDVEGVERTATASGSWSRIAFAYPRNGSSAACSTPAVNSSGCALSQVA
jgi:hypothetical protein